MNIRQHNSARVSRIFVVTMKKIIVTIDGPAGAGKSTTARRVAEELGYVYIDTGAMYRCVTLCAIEQKVPLTDEALGQLSESCSIHMELTQSGQAVYLNNKNVTSDIRTSAVTELVSVVSTFPRVRKAMVKRQRTIGVDGGVVMDGRDIGSVVFPNAEVKVFLVADADERIQRRLREITAKGEEIPETVVRHQINDRDKLDSERKESPLIQPNGAVVIDTTHLTIDQQVGMILDLVRSYQKTYSFLSAYGNI